MKPIQFEIDEIPQSGTIDADGNFKFYIYASNYIEEDFSEVIETVKVLWDLETEVSFKVQIKLKDVYENLFDMYNAQGKVQKDDTPLFECLRKDCQWIIDQINALEMNT
jgi:hypothetical protein